MYCFLTVGWEIYRLKSAVWCDRGRTGPFSWCNLHKQVCSCTLWKEAHTVSLPQHGFWHLHQQAAQCLRSRSAGQKFMLRIQHLLCVWSPLFAPVWSSELIWWSLGTHISKHLHLRFLLSSIRNPFHMLCNANTGTVTGDNWELCSQGMQSKMGTKKCSMLTVYCF